MAPEPIMVSGQVIRFGRFTLNPLPGSLLEGDAELKLRPKSFQVLAYLARNPGRLVAKDELVNAVWPDVVVTDNSLAQCISDIRNTLRDHGERVIKTVPRRGYVFVADMADFAQQEAAASAPLPEAPKFPRAFTSRNDNRPPHPALVPWPRRDHPRIVRWAVVLMLLCAAAVVLWMALPRPPALKSGEGLTIVILPFEDQGAGQHVSVGVAEELTTAMSRFRDVRVIARNSAIQYRSDIDPAAVGSRLGASFVVRGSIARDGDSTRVTVQLIETLSGAIRWAARYEQSMTSLFALQDEIAERIVSALIAQARHFTSERTRFLAPSSLEAYELVLKARLALGRYGRKEADEALMLLEQALRLEPRYAAAWGTLTRVYIRLYLHPIDERHMSPRVLEQALEAAETAVYLDPEFSYTHAALGYVKLWQHRYDESIVSLRHAISLNPYDATAYLYYGDVLGRNGHQRASIAALERSRQLDPATTPSLVAGTIARGYIMLGEHDKALAIARQCPERASDASACLAARAIAASALGKSEEAEASRQRLLEAYPGYSIGRWVRRFRHDRDDAMFVAHLRQARFPE
jgi:DNA-binding winged helix-turn-helix (wHTH) protein/TolB-like protein/Tfp pilus assembly protein PilF